MNEAYEIMTRCIAMLRESDLPRVQKLQAEIQLLRAKRFLLNVQGKVTDSECKRYADIESFYAKFSRHCCSPEKEAAEACKAVLEQLLLKLDALAKAVQL